MKLHNWFYYCSKGVLDATARVIFLAVGGLLIYPLVSLASVLLVQLKRRKKSFITLSKHQFCIIFNLFYLFNQYNGIKTPTVRRILESICRFCLQILPVFGTLFVNCIFHNFFAILLFTNQVHNFLFLLLNCICEPYLPIFCNFDVYESGS